MTIALKVLDRLVLQVSLPTMGEFVTMAVVQDIRDRTRITASEAAKLGMKDTPGGPVWNPASDDPVKFDFSNAELGLIRQTLNKMNEEKKISIDHVGLYKVFIAGTENIIPFHRPVSADVKPDGVTSTTEGETA